ncbi:MAG TPA: galactose-1-phosphate uridylyltransferase [Acidobacteriota bacterium]
MPELRHDPLQHRWVIISTERGRRPDDFVVDNTMPDGGFCPFCEGNEAKAPAEIYSIRTNGSAPNTPGWRVRVVPNKFPALKVEGELKRRGHGLYDAMNGVGAHEVIVESPDHEVNLPDLALSQVELVLRAYRDRLNDLMNDRRLRYVLIFKNYGLAAGATLAHPHSQLIATPVTPKNVAMELKSAMEHFNLKERCIYCDIIQDELEAGTRVVALNDDFVVITPYASRFPFEVFLAPRRHRHDFAAITDDQIRSLAGIFSETLRRIKVTLNDPPYNFVLHTSPNTKAGARRVTYWQTIEQDFHWHIEILPRLTRVAGFEWGTGFYVNPAAPEEAARFLREAEV